MLKGKWKGRTPFLKVRFEDFRTFTVQKTLAHYVTSGEELHQVMMAFLKEKWKGSPKIRLIGLGFHSIEKIDEYSQGELFEDDNTRKRQVEESVFRIKSRFPELPFDEGQLVGAQEPQQPPGCRTQGKGGHKGRGGRNLRCAAGQADQGPDPRWLIAISEYNQARGEDTDYWLPGEEGRKSHWSVPGRPRKKRLSPSSARRQSSGGWDRSRSSWSSMTNRSLQASMGSSKSGNPS
jgi:hypothetical protein